MLGDVYLDEDDERKASEYFNKAISYTSSKSRLFKVQYKLISYYLFTNPLSQILKDQFECVKKYEYLLSKKER